MQIWPAIDILKGRCVRLQQGDYQRETIFAEDPVAVAEQWVAQGAECLHLVDLDGARDGHVINRQVIQAIVQAVPVPCELGGGIRDEATIEAWLEIGLAQLVVGTRALQDSDWFRRMTHRFPRRLALGIDARQGRAATDGWLKTSEMAATDLARSFQTEPVASIIYTDIGKDGMLAGPNLDAMGPRFPDMSEVYDRDLMSIARKEAANSAISLREGVYVGVLGPSLETPSETRFLRMAGADGVGMSTVSEVIVGVHCGLRILLIVAITNVNIPDAMEKTSIEEVISAAEKASPGLSLLWERIIGALP